MSEEQTQQLMQQMQMLETYFSELSQREVTFLNVLKETTASIESIKSLSEKPESETLIPIGIGTYIPTKILSNSKIVLSIGAGVAVEKDFPSAINYLEAHIKEIEVALQDNAAKKQDAAAQLEKGREQINQLMQSVSQPKSG
ncbi:MAG: prefoldin subunit alpha [Nitrosopumilus sp.]